MYSIEYKWTRAETYVTTIVVKTDKVSNRKPHFACNIAQSIHVVICI
jgi:hypothetical protein